MTDRAPIFLLCVAMVLVAILLIVAMRSFTSLKASQARLAAENSYKSFAARAVEADEKAAATLTEVRRDTAELTLRMRSIEAILKDVG
jgi:type II secretory pathway pseudopilin PulG